MGTRLAGSPPRCRCPTTRGTVCFCPCECAVGYYLPDDSCTHGRPSPHPLLQQGRALKLSPCQERGGVGRRRRLDRQGGGGGGPSRRRPWTVSGAWVEARGGGIACRDRLAQPAGMLARVPARGRGVSHSDTRALPEEHVRARVRARTAHPGRRAVRACTGACPGRIAALTARVLCRTPHFEFSPPPPSARSSTSALLDRLGVCVGGGRDNMARVHRAWRWRVRSSQCARV